MKGSVTREPELLVLSIALNRYLVTRSPVRRLGWAGSIKQFDRKAQTGLPPGVGGPLLGRVDRGFVPRRRNP